MNLPSLHTMHSELLWSTRKHRNTWVIGLDSVQVELGLAGLRRAPSKKKVLASCQGCFTDSRHQQTSIQTYFWHVAFFFGPIAIHPTVGSTVGKKPTSLHRQASKAAKNELKVCSGVDFHIKTNLRTGKIGQILPFFFPWFWPWFFTFKKKKPLIFEN